ncbi:MAG: cytochrome c3 family protein [Candidatus Lernaella stagnicola]|nr:cytochrome c3 family protein [Candidatus Lernaella stagnicola]
MKKTLAILMALAFVMAIAGAVLAVDDVIKLAKDYKGGLDFTHKKHNDYAGGNCKTCHHTGENTACHTCHDATGSKAGGINTKTAFHKQCKDCHKKMGKGPTGCKDCHSG